MKEEKKQRVIENIRDICGTILLMLGLITLIGVVSAINYSIEAGESITIQLPESYAGYNITGNSSEVYITQNGLNVNITISKYENNNFEIIFFNEKEEIITKHSGSGGWARPNKINVTNQSQQEDSSEINTNFSSPTDLPPILNISNNVNQSSDELNKEAKNFLKQILDFIKSYWIFILGILIVGFIIWIIYYLYENSDETEDSYTPPQEKINFLEDEN